MKLVHSPHIHLLRSNHNMLWAFIGMLISRLGDGIYSVAIIATAYSITKSGSGTGIVLASFAISSFIFGSISGVFSDKTNRKFLLVVSSFVCGCIIVIMAALSFGGHLELISLSVLSFILGAATQFFEPTVSAMIPMFVKKEELTTANGAIGMTDSIGYLIGPALGGVLLTVMRIEIVLLLNACSFFVAALAGLLLKIPANQNQSRGATNLFQDAIEGFSYVGRNKYVLKLFLISSLSLLAYSPFFVLLPVYLDKEILLSSDQQSALIGFIYSALALGQFVGYWIVSYLKMKTYQYFMLSSFIQAVGFGSLAILHRDYLIIICIFIAGISFGISGSAFNTALQSRTPNNLLGRVYGVNYTISGVITPLGRSVSGFMSDVFGSRLIFVMMGGVLLSSSILARTLKRTKQDGNKNHAHNNDVNV